MENNLIHTLGSGISGKMLFEICESNYLAIGGFCLFSLTTLIKSIAENYQEEIKIF
jgi:hypothetical protein